MTNKLKENAPEHVTSISYDFVMPIPWSFL